MRDSRSLRQSQDALVDAIYSGLTQETPWADALELLRVALDSNVACLRISVKGAQPREYLFAAGPKACQDSIAEWEARSARELQPIALNTGEPRVINWSEIAPFSSMPDMLKRYDISYSACLLLNADNGIEYVLYTSRGVSASAFSAEDLTLLGMIGGHFSRALKLRQELIQARVVNEFQSDTLDRLGIAAVLVGMNGNITVLNSTARRMLTRSEWLRLRGGRLHAVDDRDDRLFQSILKNALGCKAGDRSRAMLIQHGGSGRELNLLVSGRRSVSLVTGRDEPCVLVFVGRSSVADEADLKVMQELFSFTPAEAKLALGLAKGLPLEDIELALNIRHNTARAHLRSIFLKADVSRQSELVHRLANSLAPLGRSLEHASTAASSPSVN
jgi:DNA-binding CsgD family transcriptional regulator/GAF domain-containing protein